MNTNEVHGRLSYLDGARGLASFCVLIHHFFMLVYPTFLYQGLDLNTQSQLVVLMAHTPLGIWCDGNFAVTFFFVLSGFVLFYSYEEYKLSTLITLIKACLRRYIRLTLPIIAVCFATFVLLKLNLVYSFQADSLNKEKWIGKFLLTNYSWYDVIIQAAYENYINFKNSKTFSPVLWTIGVELKGSFIVFTLIYLKKYIKPNWLKILIFLVLFIYSMNTYYLCFFFGVAIAFIKKNKTILSHFKKFQWLYLLGFIYLGGVRDLDHPLYAWFKMISTDKYGHLLTFKIIGSVCLMLLLITNSKIQSVLQKNVFLYIGKLSYSLYLTHFLILITLGSYLHLNTSIFVNFCMSTVLAMLTAHLFNFLIDAPSIRISKGLFNRRVKKL